MSQGDEAGGGAGKPLASAPRDRDGPVAFGLGRAELERTLLFAGLLFLSAMVLVVGRSARDALFLTAYPVSWIAPMWIAYSVVGALVALAYAKLSAKLAGPRFVVAFTLVAAVSFVALRLAIHQGLRGVLPVLYVWTEVIANLVLVPLWALVQGYHDARTGKRLFGFIGAGRIVGTVFAGFMTGAIAPSLGTENLLFVLVATLAGIAALTAVTVARHPPPERARVDATEEPAGGAGASSKTAGYVTTLAIVTLVIFAVTTVGDYQFKAIARASFPDKEKLANFMGNYHGTVGAVGLVVQLVVAPRLLRRFGVAGGMISLPAAFASTTLALLAAPSVVFATMLKISDNGLQYTIYESTMQLLFFPFSARRRERVRLLMTAVFKPLGYGVGAAALLVIAPGNLEGAALVASASRLGLYTLPATLGVIALMPLLRRGYVAAMQHTLVRRGVADDEAPVAGDGQLVAALREVLRDGSAPRVLFALDQLVRIDPRATREAVAPLLAHESPRVRQRALELARATQHEDRGALARGVLADPDPAVRTLAVEIIAEVGREDAHDELCALAEVAERNDDDAVRAAAIASLIRHCGLDGMLDGAPRLRALLDSDDDDDRVFAARALGMVGEESLQRALAKLMTDRSPAVRKAAVMAASAVRDERLLPLLFEALEDPALAAAAAKAIAALGARAVRPLAERLADASARPEARLGLPRVLAAIGTAEALAALIARMGEDDAQLRQKILASASRLRLALGAPPLDLATVRAHIDRQIDELEQMRRAYLAVRPALGRPLLDEHFVGLMRKSIIRVLRLCELAYPREVIAAVRAHLFGADPTLRANAFEVMESLLDPALRERLVERVEEVIRMRAGVFPLFPGPMRAHALDDFAKGLLRSSDAYGAMLALDSIAWSSLAAGGSAALEGASHESPLVREAAAIALATLMPEGAREVLVKLARDEDPVVAAFARYWAETGKSGLDAGDAMYTTIEKVLFLQRVPVFANVGGDDLVALARGSVVEARRRDEVIFREGDVGGALYFVIAGEVRLTLKGREVALLHDGEVFGEMSIFDREPRAVTAAIKSDEAELLRVSAEEFHEAVRETVEIAEAVIQVLNRRLREADRRLAQGRAQATASGAPERASLDRPAPDSNGAPSSASADHVRESIALAHELSLPSPAPSVPPPSRALGAAPAGAAAGEALPSGDAPAPGAPAMPANLARGVEDLE